MSFGLNVSRVAIGETNPAAGDVTGCGGGGLNQSRRSQLQEGHKRRPSRCLCGVKSAAASLI